MLVVSRKSLGVWVSMIKILFKQLVETIKDYLTEPWVYAVLIVFASLLIMDISLKG